MLLRIFFLFLFFLFQLAVRDNLLFFGFAPNLLIIGLVLTVKKNNLLDGVLLGAGCGLLYDLVSYGYFGFGIFSLTLSGFLTAFFKKQVFTDNAGSKMLIAFLLTLLNGIISLFVINYFYVPVNLTREFVRVVLPEALCTSVFLGALLLLFYFFGSKTKKVKG